MEAIRDKDRQREQLIDTVYNSQVYRSRRVPTSPIAKKPASATTPMPTVAEGVAMTDTMAAHDGGESSTSSSSSTSSASASDDAPMAAADDGGVTLIPDADTAIETSAAINDPPKAQ